MSPKEGGASLWQVVDFTWHQPILMPMILPDSPEPTIQVTCKDERTGDVGVVTPAARAGDIGAEGEDGAGIAHRGVQHKDDVVEEAADAETDARKTCPRPFRFVATEHVKLIKANPYEFVGPAESNRVVHVGVESDAFVSIVKRAEDVGQPWDGYGARRRQSNKGGRFHFNL